MSEHTEHTEDQMNDAVEQLRLKALARVRVGQIEDALEMYDAALAQTSDEAMVELITINKADAMIAIGRSGPEIQALPAIVMRRRSLRHTFLASYALVFKYRTEKEVKRATFYGRIALQAAEEIDDPQWKIGALNELGVLYEVDSQFASAIRCFEDALTLLESAHDAQQSFIRVPLLANLAYNKLLTGDTREGLKMMHSVIEDITLQDARADALIELCFGYVDLEQYDEARAYGEAALEIATEPRQVRNAHYLLGEAAYKSGDTDRAEHHFDELSKFYPDFQHLKPLLYALDLRSMVNLKL